MASILPYMYLYVVSIACVAMLRLFRFAGLELLLRLLDRIGQWEYKHPLFTTLELSRLESTRLDTMVFLHLFIVNKSGGLIHHRPLSPKAPKIGTNEWLRIGSTFHSLHAIAAEASPVKKLPNGKNSCTSH
jgi:hypothetical protein